MQPVTMYTKPYCGFCHAAKRLLASKGVDFTEIDIQAQPARRAEMIQKAGGRTTAPQIWIGTLHVGGFDDMYDLEHSGKLDPLLKG